MPDNAPQLRDIHVPTVSAWWPLAPGWWSLLGLVVAIAVILVIAVRRRAARRRRLDSILGDVRRAAAVYAADGDAAAFAASASHLLRRVARTRDAGAVTLSGEAWRTMLGTLAPKLDTHRLVALDTAMYRRSAELDVTATLADIETWVRTVLAGKIRR